MQHFTRTARTFALTCTLATASLAQGAVHVVDDDGGPGVDFTVLQDAVDAAADGDLILVETGNYFSMTIDAKSLIVVADEGAEVTIGAGVEVTNLAATGSVAVRGLTVSGAPGLMMSANQGPVLFDECTLLGAGVPVFLPAPGANVVSSDDVTFSHCTLRATTDGSNDPGLLVQGASVHLYECELEGASGGQSLPGGTGCALIGCSLFASGSTFTGGRGGDGTVQGPFMFCTDGGDGGAGLSMTAHPQCLPDVDLLDCSFTGGEGGEPGSPDCDPGVTGQPIQQFAGDLTTLAGVAHRFEITSPAREGDAASLSFHGQPGELAFGVVSLDTTPVFNPVLKGTLIPDATPFVWFYAGVIPGSGVRTIPVSPSLNAGDAFLALYEQSLIYDAFKDEWTLGSPHVGVILDASL